MASEMPMPTQTHLPLATRFIGGTFLLWGLLSMHGIVQALLVGRGPILDFNVFLALVGWGILRGREGARVWGVLLTGAMGVLGGIGLLVAGAAAVGIIETSDSSTLTISPNVPMATAGVLLFFFVCCGSVRHLLSETTKAAHFSRATPRKWSWGPWTWLTVLLFVAFCSLSWATEPAVQYRARKLGLVRVPSYLEGLPTLPAGRGAPVEWEGAPGGWIHMMSYGYRTGLGSLGPPQLDFVVFGAAVGSAHAPTIDYGGDPSSQWEVGLTLGDGREIRIPDQTQLFGLVEGEFTRSEMHISFPEFWHYLHWDKDTHSLPELEEHVKRLREMLAE